MLSYRGYTPFVPSVASKHVGTLDWYRHSEASGSENWFEMHR